MSEIPGWLFAVMKVVFPYLIRFRFYLQGIARHSLAEMDAFSFADLDSISTQLGDKPFFLGSEPTSIDCTLFGHLAQFLYIPLDFPQKAHMREKCPNLVAYVDRVRERFWPDWEEMCDDKCMEGRRGKAAM